ncbi:MAG: alanine--tRNA ligase [Gammaproteobacteria bacterium]|nr:alanine--tRNA ligase [Gammaproteobacteria bacterium]
MDTAEIRSTYLAHFANRGHRVVPSAPLIPSDDPTILFTVAGMVQFKDALTGVETLSYSRATSCQRCVRAGGKHNDLENVGYTARHHTFFEMLGNFSFGDYFKEEAIEWAWEYVNDVIGLEKDRLWFTVHPSDDEARKLWIDKIGIDPARVIDHEDNFWTMGDTGPCGPCTEIFFDQGPSIAGGPPGSKDEDGDRFLEIWNLVFPQFDRQPDGELEPLAKPGVDTGLGLERLAAVTQGVDSGYGTDVFAPIFVTLDDIVNRIQRVNALASPSCRVIADHVRAASFLISDGILPDREGRGYVLRRIIRRALRHGHKLGIDEPFFHKLVQPLVETMGDAYPELVTSQERTTKALLDEEVKFGETMQRGLNLLEDALKNLSGKTVPGEIVFKLYDTYGFPVDLTADIAREQGLMIDQSGFDDLMREQQDRARAAGQFQSTATTELVIDGEVDFVGYEQLGGESQIVQVFAVQDGQLVETAVLQDEQDGAIVLERTAFYGEAGGQVGDIGTMISDDAQFNVVNVTRSNDQFVHYGQVQKGSFVPSQTVRYEVNAIHRQDVARNHSATHLLHAALKRTLGSHVQQRGSLVEAPRLRFDFSHDQPVTDHERLAIETSVNEQILANAEVETNVLPYDDAIASGAVALFGEKYADEVRVLNIGDGFSVELCGGTHVGNLGEIGLFKIVSESGIAAGVRRVEAITGRKAYERFRDNESLLSELSDRIGTSDDQLPKRIEQLVTERKQLQKQLEDALSMKLRDRGADLVAGAQDIGELKLVASIIDGTAETMMASFDDVRSRLADYVVVLAVVDGGKYQLVCGVSNSLTKLVKANDVIAQLKTHVPIRGGGKPSMARAGGTAAPADLENGLTSLAEWLETKLSE